ncbi:questin oxidase family protein [Chitinimonas arctica]|uniref:Questin oxidase family protein n=1 Tax=Chitinimonas arctica TaxID=2594795 RepID=A0A516SI61_9NEIS|nr:questin oxidase family protein [Chitinimonas arctica]QDQ27841.1 questin oxidase family protein [Chitinimonas arctica]
MTTTTVASSLQGLLDQNAHFALQARGTTNHCPMALVALAKMGAGPARLQAFFAYWTTRYAIARDPHPGSLKRQEWQARAGDSEAFGSLRLLFTDWIAAEGVAAVVATVLAQAAPAPATGAFHALIRLAYGLEADHGGEVAAGLAAYVANQLLIPLGDAASRPAESVAAGLHTLSRQFAGKTWPGQAITARLRGVAADPLFLASLPRPPQSGDLLAQLAHAAIALYWQTSNFTVLHMVTGVHAARLVMARLPAATVRIQSEALWAAYCAAYVSVGAPALADDDPPAAPTDWATLLALAVDADDDHTIKLVYSCWQEDAHAANPAYLAAAARLLHGRRGA